jgi:hypothetical protein
MTTELQELEHPHGPPDVPTRPQLAGLLAEFGTVDEIFEAARRIRAAGYKTWDVHSPFPIHGIDAVIGIRPTILPWLVLGGGLTGLGCGLLLQWWCNAIDYPFLVSGKPFFSLPANIPIIFECTVLFSALTTVFGMLGLNRLPLLYQPIFKSARFKRVTDDKLFIWMEASDPQFEEQKTTQFLSSLGAASVERIED